MPTLRKSSNPTQIPLTLSGTSSRTAVVEGARVISEVDPAAPDGNTVDDHLKSIYARLGNFHGDGEWRGTYSNSTTYAVGDEVDWTDGSNKLRFFKCILAGDDGGSGTPITNTNRWIELVSDIHDISVENTAVIANTAILERLPNGTINFNRRIWSEIAAKITQSDATDLINKIVNQIVDDAIWRGEWTHGRTYRIGDFSKYNSTYYKRLTNGQDASGENPASNTGDWAEASTLETEIAQRLENITNLMSHDIGLAPALADRGHWLKRFNSTEGYQFTRPPMQFRGVWDSGTSYHYGDVTTHLNDTWCLTDPTTITSAKRGTAEAPGTDTAWVKFDVKTSTLTGFPHYRGEWGDANGQTTVEGDIWKHNEGYYIRRTGTTASPGAINTGGSGPDTDETNYALIDSWDDNGWNTNRWYHEGTMLAHNGEVHIAEETINHNDPEPGASNNRKWRQITGNTPALEQLREDLTAQIHAAITSTSDVVTTLPTADADAKSSLLLTRMGRRTWTAPASLITGDNPVTRHVGDEPGEYNLTQGTVNRARIVCGKRTIGSGADARIWYGWFSRADEIEDFAANLGSVVHSPVGSGIIAAGVEQLNATDWKIHLVMKSEIFDIIEQNEDRDDPTWFLKTWSHDGTAQTAKQVVGDDASILVANGVYYTHFAMEHSNSDPFGSLYENAADDSERVMDIGFALTASGAERWLGNTVYGWTRQPPVDGTDEVPIVSDQIRREIVISRSDYNALTSLQPFTKYLVHA